MAQVQPPRYTSTPRVRRSTSREEGSALNDFIQMSPIYPILENARQTKSIVQDQQKNEIRSYGVQSLGTKRKDSDSTVGTVLPKGTLKSQIPKRSPHMEPRNSVDEGKTKIAVIPSSSNTGLDPAASTITSSGGNSRPNSQRFSKISQRPSTLPIVPEEGSKEGTEGCILKKPTSCGEWLIPKESKSRVSLKRKPSVPLTVTKRNKNVKTNSELDDESLFDSPELPNLADISSLHCKRRTYVLKKKPGVTGIEEENHESVSDGIVPLQITQNSSQNNLGAKNIQEGSKNHVQETKRGKNIKTNNLTASKVELVKVYEDKENVEDDVSSDIKIYHTRRRLTPEPGSKLTVNQSKNSKTGSVVTAIGENTKPTKSTKEVVQKKTFSSFPEQEIKENEFDVYHKDKETKNKTKKPGKKETKLSQNLNAESTKSITVLKRSLRERKPNRNYQETSMIDEKENSKENIVKKEEQATIKPSLENKENSHEPQVKNKVQRKNTVKGNKKKSCVRSESEDLPLHRQSASDNNQTNKEENTGRDKEGNTGRDTTTKLETKEKGRKHIATHTVIQALVSEEQLIQADLNEKPSPQQTNQCRDSSSKTQSGRSSVFNAQQKSQHKKLSSTTQNDEANQTNEANTQSHNYDALIDRANVISASTVESTSKNTKINKQGSDILLETKNRRKTVRKTSSDNPSMPEPDVEPDGNNQKMKGKSNKVVVEETEKSKRKTIPKSSQSRVKVKKSNVCEGSRNNGVETNCNTLPVGPLEEENCEPHSGKKRKSEDMDRGSPHSDSESASKRQKRHNLQSGQIVNNGLVRYLVEDLFEINELKESKSQPGVTSFSGIHINKLVKMGEVHIQPGAALTKISTHSTYCVTEGVAQVKMGKTIKTLNASDEHRKFFVPMNIDVSITNVGSATLKMDFTKFRSN